MRRWGWLLFLALLGCDKRGAADGGGGDGGSAAACEACTADQVCLADRCYERACPGGPCDAGQVCAEGSCALAACIEAQCPAGSRCVGGRCYGSWCGAAECPPGELCEGARCVDERCLGVRCPTGSRCEAGACNDCDPGFVRGADGGCSATALPGEACATDAQCRLGFCRQGRCCRSACSGACEACGPDGTCGVAPRGAPGSPACAPGICDGTQRTCSAACNSAADCASGAFCRGGTCLAPQADGLACDGGHECASGLCARGICCDAACGGPCETCFGVAGAADAGVCAPSAAGASPWGQACGLSACSGASAQCPSGACGATLDCLASAYCDAGTCTPDRPGGQGCAGDHECASGFCTDGVCCEARCDANCRSCNLAGAAGRCLEDPAGTAADGGGFCADGIICATPCASPCEVCTAPDGGAGLGSCAPRGRFAASRGLACGATACDGDGGCFPACAPAGFPTAVECLEKAYCDSDSTCQFLKPAGAPCTADYECDRAQSDCCQPVTFTCGSSSCV